MRPQMQDTIKKKRVSNKKNVKKDTLPNSPWFHQADKVLINGFWYVKISDIKFG